MQTSLEPQTLPQAPQLTLLAWSETQPAPQTASPAAQAAELQLPAEHLVPAGQTVPQVPQ
jgi:hypothetical protein